MIKSNLHPVFAKVFTLDYYFEEVQKLRFEVYDIHGTHSIGTRDDDFLGGVECTLGQVGRLCFKDLYPLHFWDVQYDGLFGKLPASRFGALK